LKKKLSPKELSILYNQRLETATEKAINDHRELKRFTRRIALILLLGVTVLVVLMLVFTPGVVENAVNPALQAASDGYAHARPVVKQALAAAKSAAPGLKNLVTSAKSAIGQ
jgi:hypothetical protein